MRKLNEMAKARGQSMAQMAIAWVLRHKQMTSALIGASRVGQIEEAVARWIPSPSAPTNWHRSRRSWLSERLPDLSELSLTGPLEIAKAKASDRKRFWFFTLALACC